MLMLMLGTADDLLDLLMVLNGRFYVTKTTVNRCKLGAEPDKEGADMDGGLVEYAYIFWIPSLPFLWLINVLLCCLPWFRTEPSPAVSVLPCAIMLTVTSPLIVLVIRLRFLNFASACALVRAVEWV